MAQPAYYAGPSGSFLSGLDLVQNLQQSYSDLTLERTWAGIPLAAFSHIFPMWLN